MVRATICNRCRRPHVWQATRCDANLFIDENAQLKEMNEFYKVKMSNIHPHQQETQIPNEFTDEGIIFF